MRRRALQSSLPVLFLFFACLSACGGSEALRVTSIQLGRSLNADSTVAGHTTTFGPGDTVYLSVLTEGLGSGTIKVRWLYRGHVMGEPTREVSYKDSAATEFHLQSAGGFPPGEYTAEVFLDGQSVGSREFRVEKKR